MWMVLGLIALGTYIVVKWVSKNFDFFEKQGVKFVKPYPLIGTNTWLLGRENIAVILKRFYDQFPNEKWVIVFVSLCYDKLGIELSSTFVDKHTREYAYVHRSTNTLLNIPWENEIIVYELATNDHCSGAM